MRTNPNRFWILVLVLGWAFDFLFWGTPGPGINFFIYVILCLGTGFYLLKIDGHRLAPRSSLLLIPIVFFAAQTFFRREPMTLFLSVSMTLFLMGLFALTYINGQWMNYRLLDYITGYLRLAGSMLARPLGFSAELKKESPEREKRSNPIWPIVRGIVIALPIIGIFASLLSSADPIFRDRFEDFIDLFNIDNLPEYIFRLFYILVFAYALAGTFLHVAQKSGEEVEGKQLLAPFLGFTESSIVMGSVVVLFAAFVVIQVRYFFGGQANINLEGYTYADYARRGFGELVTVAFFSLLLVLGLGAAARRDNERQRRVFSGMSVVLVGLVIVMLVSAYQRLILYEDAYGFSRLRTYTHVFLVWLGALLMVVVLLEIFRREQMAGLAMVLASVGFVASLSLLNVDGFIVRQNIQREVSAAANEPSSRNSTGLDTNYFLELSDDAVPALAEGFTNKSVPGPVRERIGAILTCKRYTSEQDTREYPWKSYHIPRVRAQSIFEQLGSELDAYSINDDDLPVKIVTPGEEEISCWQYYYD